MPKLKLVSFVVSLAQEIVAEHAHVFEEEAMEVLAEEDPVKLRVELIQVMAVCAKWIADIDSRPR